MQKKDQEKEQARKMRQDGNSLAEIAKTLEVARSSVSVWVRNVILTDEQREELRKRIPPHAHGYIRKNGTISRKRREMGEEAWKKYQKARKRQQTLEWRRNNPEKYVNREVEIKAKLVAYKGGKCEICSYNKCLGALQFHRKNPDEKDFELGRHHKSWAKMKAEADKCMLLCSRCHDETHWKEHEEKRRKRIDEIRAGARAV